MALNDDHDPIASKTSANEKTEAASKNWSTAVLRLLGIGTMIVGTSALTGCIDRGGYSRYCNACCRNYTTPNSYCNYANYIDSCC